MRRSLAAVALFAVFIFAGVQFAGGAYTAEFDGHPDEAAHFITSLMIRDYLLHWPLQKPVAWAEQYYLHYPKVAFGHWPPLFHVTMAAWWLVTPPSRVSGLLLIGAIGLATAMLFYRLARAIVPAPAALFAACLLLATPVVQQSLALFMADILTLLFEMLLLGAMARMLRGEGRRAAAAAALWCAACLLVKGTGICLLPAPFLAMLIYGRGRRAVLWSALAVLGFAVVLYRVQLGSFATIARWAGVSWPPRGNLRLVFAPAGYGLPLVALGGILTLFRKLCPETVAAAAVTFSVAVAGGFLGAMLDARHWLLILPPMLLLALACCRFLFENYDRRIGLPTAAIAAAVCLAFFPWLRYRQRPVGYAQVADAIHQPARMLVAGAEEGSWIVLASLREPRPSSIIVRGSKLLARSGWGGESYRLLTETPAAMAATLDRLGIEDVILDEHPLPQGIPLHEPLLRQTLRTDPAWRECRNTGSLIVFCRVQPPREPRQPLRMDMRWRLGPGRVIQEK